MDRSPESVIPLNVRTYSQGFLKLQGWMVFSCLAFVTAGLLVAYELLIINVEDQDFRDMLMDYRITHDGVRHQHRYFANAQFCCHSDFAVFRYSCSSSGSLEESLGAGEPRCPPTIVFTCPNLISNSCSQVRRLLYPAAGLDESGQIANCKEAGKVLLKAQAGHGHQLTAYAGGRQLPQQLSLTGDPSSVDPQIVQDFVSDVVEQYGDPMFDLPSAPLSRSVHVDSQQVMLFAHLEPATSDKWGDFGWPWELWPWPPAASCSKTGTPAALSLEGGHKFSFQPAVDDTNEPQPTIEVSFYKDSVRVPQYQLQEVDGLVHIRSLTGVNLTVGLLAPLDACDAWQLYRPGLLLLYGSDVWQGTKQQLMSLQHPVSAGSQMVTISVHDVSEPQPLALPRYHGELYIYVALALGGIWMFATVPLIVMFGVMVINVQRNRGLPVFLYRYMRKYRGW